MPRWFWKARTLYPGLWEPGGQGLQQQGRNSHTLAQAVDFPGALGLGGLGYLLMLLPSFSKSKKAGMAG